MNKFVRILSSAVCAAFVFSAFSVQQVFASSGDSFVPENTLKEAARLIRTEDGNFTMEYLIPDEPSVGTTGRLKSSVLKPYFDLRDEGRVTSVKNQYSYGTCWAFATIASLESGLITSGAADETVDLSERHLAYFAYKGEDNSEDKSLYAGKDTYKNNGEPYGGGSDSHSIATLSRWYGAASEKEAPYSDPMPLPLLPRTELG